LVIDRGGPGENCEELALDATVLVTAAASAGREAR
jgi:hypothetical protein